MAGKRQNVEVTGMGTRKRIRLDPVFLVDVPNKSDKEDGSKKIQTETQRRSERDLSMLREDSYSNTLQHTPTDRQEFFESQYYDITLANQREVVVKKFPGPAGVERLKSKSIREATDSFTAFSKSLMNPNAMDDTSSLTSKYSTINNSSWKALKKYFNLSCREKDNILNKINIKIILGKMKRWSADDGRVPIPFLAAMITDDCDIGTVLNSSNKQVCFSVILEDNKEAITAVLHEYVVRDFGHLLYKGSSIILRKAMFHKIFGKPQLSVTKEMVTCVVVSTKTSDSKSLDCTPDGFCREQVEDEIFFFQQNTFDEKLVNDEILEFKKKLKLCRMLGTANTKPINKAVTSDIIFVSDSRHIASEKNVGENEERLSGLLKNFAVAVDEKNSDPEIVTKERIDISAQSVFMMISDDEAQAKGQATFNQGCDHFREDDNYPFLDQNVEHMDNNYKEKNDNEKSVAPSSTIFIAEGDNKLNGQATGSQVSNQFGSQDDFLFLDQSVTEIVDNYKKCADNDKNVASSSTIAVSESENSLKGQETTSQFKSQDDYIFLDQSVTNLADNYKDGNDNDTKVAPCSTEAIAEGENKLKGQASSSQISNQFASQDDFLFLDQSVTEIVDNYKRNVDNASNAASSSTVANSEGQITSSQLSDPFGSQDDYIFLDQSVTEIADARGNYGNSII